MTELQAVADLDDYLYADIVKSESQEDGSVIVFGRPSHDVVDIDDQIADKEWLKQALPEWFKWGNVREMHGPSAVGTAQRLEFDQNDDPWVTAKIVDRDAAQKVREGVYKGFSIRINKPILKRDAKARKGRFVGGKITELSLVDRPAVPTAKFEIVKSAGKNKWVDCQTGFVLEEVNKGSAIDAFDGDGDPILQPGHVRDEGEFRILEVGDDVLTVEVDGELLELPYELDASGSYVFGSPKPLSDICAYGEGPTDAGKVAGGTTDVSKAVWSTEEQNNLPDSSFAYISPGGKKDDEGKTVPRDLRHLPYKDASGKPNAPHIKDALARLDETDIPANAKVTAKRKLEAAAKEVGIDVTEDAKKAADIVKAAEDAVKKMAYCAKCEKKVKLGDKMEAEKGAGGNHVTYKGDCGHLVKKFEKDDATKAADPEENPKQEPESTPDATKSAVPETKPTVQIDADVLKSAVADAVRELFASGTIPAPAPTSSADEVHQQRVDAIKGAYVKLGEFVDMVTTIPADAFKAAMGQTGGPTPVDFDVMHTQVREGLSEFSEMARLLLNSETSLVHDNKTPGNLGPTNNPVAPESKPAGPTYDLVSVGADSMKSAMEDVAKTFGATLEAVVNPLRERLERMEHAPNNMTKAQLFVAENPGVFGESATSVSKAAKADIRQKYSEMSPREQEKFTQQLIAAARR